MTRISLVRHGQTDWNHDGRIQGRSDIPLNETGREQARATGLALAESGRRFDGVYASPLVRAMETAALIAGELDMPGPEPVPGLEERSYGLAEGMTGPEIRERFGDDRSEIPEWEDDAALLERVFAALSRLAAHHPGERVLAVAHGGVIGAVARHLTGGERPAKGETIGNGSVHEFEVIDGELRLVAFNLAPSDLAELDLDVEVEEAG
ncbi:MAG: histidine phosphatase family protein [Microbacteriaceae bacterium]|nr:histidine phosphatase family protein [Microbacteriaceae bacterium]MCL2794843.1 histidine phosphatase family protein [Microbacteriaceae bacterium]